MTSELVLMILRVDDDQSFKEAAQGPECVAVTQ